MDEKRSDQKVIWVIVSLTLVALAFVVYLVFFRGIGREDLNGLEKSDLQQSVQPDIPVDSASEAAVVKEEVDSEESVPPPVNLMESDLYLETRFKNRFQDPLIQLLFLEKGVIRKLTAIVDNIATGENPKNHLEFIPFTTPFKVVREGEQIRLNERSYSRYDEMVDTFIAFESQKIISVFKKTQSLFNQAYKDLGYPQTPFKTTLKRAIKKVLDIPVVFEKIYLEKGIVSYKYRDETLRELSDAQKQFLRMGPMNLRKIQKKVRELQSLL